MNRTGQSSRVILPGFTVCVGLSLIAGITLAAVRLANAGYLDASLGNLVLILIRDSLTAAVSTGLSLWIFISLLHLTLSRGMGIGGSSEVGIIQFAVLIVFVFGAGGWLLNRNDVFPPAFSATGILANGIFTLTVIFVGTLVFFRRGQFTRLLRPLGRLPGWIHVIPFVLLAGFVWLHFTIRERESRMPGPRPAVLLISVDTLRWDHLGCYGYDPHTSPNLDAFSREAVRFDNAMSQAPWTLPSHMSLFTSQYTLEHGMAREGIVIDSGKRGFLLAELLKNRFYRTAAFTGGGWLDPGFGFGAGFDRYEFRATTDREPIPAAALRFVEEHAGKPFFLFLHTYCVHNYYAPREYRERFGAGEKPELDEWEEIKPVLQLYRDTPVSSELGEERVEHLERLYDASIRYIDHMLGKLFRNLRKTGVYDDLLIIFTSDHGEEFGEHRHTYHGHSLYEELIHVPLIIRFPRGEYAGTVVKDLVQLIDIPPGILDYLGEKPSPWMRGRSFMPLVRGTGDREEAWSSALNRNRLKFSLRTPRYRLIYRTVFRELLEEGIGDYLLFDLVKDPGETRDIALEKPAVFDSLRFRLVDRVGELIPESVDRMEVELERDTEERLRELGYLQ